MIANGIFQRGKIENSNITSTWSFSLFLESFDYVFQNQISRQTINTFWIGRYFTSTCWTFYIGFQVRLVVRASVFLHPFCPCLRCTIRFQDFPRAWCTEIMRAWKNNRSLKKIQANRTRQLNLHRHRKKMSGLPWCGGYCFISACNLGCRWLQVWTKTWNSRAHYRACFHACPRLRFRIFSFFRLYLTLCWFAKYLVLFLSFHGVYLPFPKKNSLCKDFTYQRHLHIFRIT